MTDHDPLCRQQHWNGGDCFDCRLIAKVRADERDHGWQEGYDAGIAYAVEKYQHTWSTRLADLRAQVQALPWVTFETSPVNPLINRADVLALLDGGSE